MSQPACAAAVLWNRHTAWVITSIITSTQHSAIVTKEARIKGLKGTYEIYLQLVLPGTLRETAGIIEMHIGRERKEKMVSKKSNPGLL